MNNLAVIVNRLADNRLNEQSRGIGNIAAQNNARRLTAVVEKSHIGVRRDSLRFYSLGRERVADFVGNDARDNVERASRNDGSVVVDRERFIVDRLFDNAR